MEQSPVGSRFSELLFPDVTGTATERVRTCGFRRNLSSFDSAPKIRDSLLSNSFESFLVTCEGRLLPLGRLDNQSGEKTTSLRDRDRLRNDPQWVPGFLSCHYQKFPERLRNTSELVGLGETRQVLTRHPRHETMSY